VTRWFLAAALLGALAGCARPPKIATTLELKRKAAGVEVTLQVKNLEARPTTPILVRLMAEARTGGKWMRPQAVLSPAAFVLNRNEEHSFSTIWKTDADAVRTVLVVKEAENGNLLKTEKSERELMAPAGAR
jgi:hypothetical protein